MLMRTDPFRLLDRITHQAGGSAGTWTKPNPMPMDAYRTGDEYVVAFDLPGVSADAIDLDIEHNVLTVRAERRPPVLEQGAEVQVSERPLGVFSRQLFLGDTLDADRITADYEGGVLTLRMPVVEQAKPRKIAVSRAASGHHEVSA